MIILDNVNLLSEEKEGEEWEMSLNVHVGL